MKVKKNDTVMVIAGKDKGKTGKIVAADPKNAKVKVEGVNIQKRHKKPRSAQDVGGIIDQVGAIDVSNVQVVCDKCHIPTRVAMKEVDGKKVRTCKHCGAVLDKAKEEKKAVKKSAAKKETAKKETKEGSEKKTAKKAPAAKKPAAKKAEQTDAE